MVGVDPFTLNVITLTSDASIARDVAQVCTERGHLFSHLRALGTLRGSLSADVPNVLLIDWLGEPIEGEELATAISSAHPDVAVVLAMPAPGHRTIGTFRVIDRWRSGERLVDELELAYIAIPPVVAGLDGEAVQPKG